MNSINDAEHASDELNRIVSVNNSGLPPGRLLAKLLLMALTLAILAVGSLFGYNRYRAMAKAQEAQSEAALKGAAPRPGRPHHIFAADPPAATGAHATAAAPAGTCTDGSVGEVLTDSNGKPYAAPGGQPLRFCRTGTSIVPWLDREGNAIPSGGPAAASPPANMAAASRPSRYGGDILLPSPTAAHLAPDSAPSALDLGNPLLQALLASTTGTTASRGTAAAPPPPTMADGTATGTVAEPHSPPPDAQGPLPQLTVATPATKVRASLIGDRDMILPEGRTIDCNLSLRLVNDVSGKAVCVVSSYVYSDSGRVALIEPGSVATGEYAAMMAHGQRRLFVLWTRIKTANGVIINVNSPAADALGTSGLDGTIDNRWSERLGAAFLRSTVQDVIGYETAKAAGGNASGGVTVLQNTSEAGNRMAERILDSTINIKPTIYKQQGDRATIFVARDLDFGSVYVLHGK